MDYAKILREAFAAAKAAVKGEHDVVAFNCGFAWVNINGTDGLARFCRAHIRAAGKAAAAEASSNGGDAYRARIIAEQDSETYYGSKGYPRGWQFYDPSGYGYHGQDMDVKAKGARAFQDILANYGIRAEVRTRLD